MSQEHRKGKIGNNLPQIRSIALIALGSNVNLPEGDATEIILSSVESLKRCAGVIRGVSRLYRTPAFPAGAGPDFCNAAVVIETGLDGEALLARLHLIEAEEGRVRTRRWGPRTLDLDLIALGAEVLPDLATQTSWMDLPLEVQMRRAPDRLVLPHPRLQDRAFVLVPLAEALERAGLDWAHPVLGVSVAEMLAALTPEQIAEVEALQ